MILNLKQKNFTTSFLIFTFFFFGEISGGAEDSLDARIIKNYQKNFCQWEDETSAPECNSNTKNWSDLSESLRTAIQNCPRERIKIFGGTMDQTSPVCLEKLEIRKVLFESHLEGFMEALKKTDCSNPSSHPIKPQNQETLPPAPCKKILQVIGRDMSDFDDCKDKNPKIAKALKKGFEMGFRAGQKCPPKNGMESNSNTSASQTSPPKTRRGNGRGPAARQ